MIPVPKYLMDINGKKINSTKESVLIGEICVNFFITIQLIDYFL